MGSHRNRVCILSTQEANSYTRTGIRPGCLDHEHVSLTVARELTAELLYSKRIGEGITARLVKVYEFDWVTPVEENWRKNRFLAIVPKDPRRWTIRKSGYMDVHQLVT